MAALIGRVETPPLHPGGIDIILGCIDAQRHARLNHFELVQILLLCAVEQ